MVSILGPLILHMLPAPWYFSYPFLIIKIRLRNYCFQNLVCKIIAWPAAYSRELCLLAIYFLLLSAETV